MSDGSRRALERGECLLRDPSLESSIRTVLHDARSLTIEVPVRTESSVELDAGSRAALEAGKPVVYVCPPAAWACLPLFDRLVTTEASHLILALVAGPAEALELAEVLATQPNLAPVYSCSALGRTGRRLAADAVRTLVTSPGDALELMRRSQLTPERIRSIVLVWPEMQLALDQGAAIDALLGECRSANRLFVTADSGALADLLERHAYRAPVHVFSSPPGEPLGGIRYAVALHERIRWSVRTALDVLNPATALLWDPSPLAEQRWAEYGDDPLVRVAAEPGAERVDLAIAAELPTAEALLALKKVGRQVLVLAHATQLPYLRRLAQPLGVVRLPSEVDRARDRAVELRRAVREKLEEGSAATGLYALAPLFDEYDPALVAAAALGVSPLAGGGAPAVTGEPTHWVRVRLEIGNRDRIRTGDIVGALINAVGVARHDVGRVDIRDRFTIVDLRADVAERAAKGLHGLMLRGRQVSARLA